MEPSSGTKLSAKSQPARPLSSLSHTSSSRNATQRPASSLETRPTSSASTRPQSRFSQRPSSRHARSRLMPMCQTLVTQVTGLRKDGTESDADGEQFREAVDYVLKHVENTVINKTSASVDMDVIDRRMSGLALKARINSQDVFAEALDLAYKRLKTHIEERKTDLDQEIKTSHIPDHLQFLLNLNQAPTEDTVESAKAYLNAIAHPPSPPPNLTWADILAQDPFEGEHWEGVDIPGGEAMPRQRDREDWDSSPSLSPLSSDDSALEDEGDSLSSAAFHESPEESLPSASPSLQSLRKSSVSYPYKHRKAFEELMAKQYWRNDWYTDANPNARFDIGDPSTLGPTLSRVSAETTGFQDAHAMLKPERYINEGDMTREILLALQGNKNIILLWEDGKFKMMPNTPRLIHLSLASQQSIISSLAGIASTVQNLRLFSATVFSRSIFGKPLNGKLSSTRTCEAFADAIDEAVRGFNAWCTNQEEAMCRACLGIDEEPLVVSLLGIERAIRDNYEASFDVLLQVVRHVFNTAPKDDIVLFDQNTQMRQPAVLTALLLDTLFANVQQHMERRETVTSDALMRVFVRTAEPVWNMVGKWLKDGMGLGLGVGTGGKTGAAKELDDEFFIESSGIGLGMMGMGLLDPEFWKEGYAIREHAVSSGESGQDEIGYVSKPPISNRRAIPLFLEHVADMVLSTGKAVGLMRALGNPFVPDTSTWKTFADLVCSETQVDSGSKEKNFRLFSVSVDTLSKLIYDELLPYCQVTGTRLSKVLVEECFLWKHVQAIEDFYLMRKGDAMSLFVDVLFTKMDSLQSWADFHFLNAAFNDVIEANTNAGSKEWINASLVRLSYRRGKERDRSIQRTVKAIEGLWLEYAVPFPLNYIFEPRTIQGYNEIFIFLLQIRRAKSVLEHILVRNDGGKEKTMREELKVFYAMRSRLSWFTNTLLNFLTTYVIHSEVLRFHEAFRKAETLDEMIQLHDEHLEKIRSRCLLKPNTSALHRTILSILDMCLHFSEGFVAFAGDTTATLDISRQSTTIKRHRSRRQRRQRRNVIGFSQFLHEDGSSDEYEDDIEVEPGDLNASLEPCYSVTGSSIADDGTSFSRVERMSSELDGLVRFLRRGVESLAGGTSEAAPAFGVLAFSLEDWDI